MMSDDWVEDLISLTDEISWLCFPDECRERYAVPDLFDDIGEVGDYYE